ncbi:hypothetical protein NHJ13734_003735 [Beauveria thailandica]
MPGLAGIVLHGGASESWIGDKKRYDDTTAFLQTVVSSAESALEHGALAIDLAVEVVAKLEDYPAFNAGRGSAVNIDGNFELEAGIVCGATSAYRAAVCLQATKNPIKLVRAMLDDTGPSASVFIAGPGGDDLAKRLALDIVPNCYFATESRTSYWRRKRAEISEHGTVGAVVRDSHGNVAAANSTGGMMFKPVGRVGDTAVLGSGLYADKRVAIACSGGGEAIMASMLASRIANLYNNGIGIATAVEEGIWHATQLFPSISCGVIAITANGQQTYQCNSRIFNVGSSGLKSRHIGLLRCTMPVMAPLCIHDDDVLRVGVSKHPTRPNQLTFQLKGESSLVSLSDERALAVHGRLRKVGQALAQIAGASDVAMLSWAGGGGGHLFPVMSGGHGESESDDEKKGQTACTDADVASRDAPVLAHRTTWMNTDGSMASGRQHKARNDANVSSMWMLQDDAEFRGAVDALQRVLKNEASSPADAFPHQEWSLFAGPGPGPPRTPSLSATAAVSTPYCRAVLVASSNADPYWPSPAPFLDAGGNCNHLHDDAGLGLTAALGPRALDLSGLLGLAEKLRACLD